MKRNLMLLLLLFFMLGAWRYTQNFPNRLPDDTIDASVNVTFGRRGASCSGSGVCSFESQSSLTPKSPELNQTAGRLFFNEFGKLVMQTQKEQLSASLIENYFSDETFLLQDTLFLEAPIKDSLHLTGLYQILPGTYPIVETETAFEVIF